MNNTVQEVWYQLASNPTLWEGEGGLIVNTAALDEREAYFEVTRVASYARADVLEGSSALQQQ